jgi:hypothetical protein
LPYWPKTNKRLPKPRNLKSQLKSSVTARRWQFAVQLRLILPVSCQQKRCKEVAPPHILVFNTTFGVN